MDPFQKGITITIATAPSQPTSPIAALKAMFMEFPYGPDAPLFEQPDGKALSYAYFVKSIWDALSSAGYDPSLYAGHSFHCGAALEAAATGYLDYKIQLLSCWCSDAYKLYIENDLTQILYLSSLLHMAHTQVTPFEPLVLCGYMAMA
ncbi:hypothetical protein H0H87_003168 [Tephrocybe sp. NHM501043]|nr:hypothetical protein H0H87_003168 [Tephrocybe sp. NHM501043]